MQRIAKCLAMVLPVASLMSGEAKAATSITADVTAQVVEMLLITNQQPLTFGEITSVNSSGTVVIGTNNLRGVTGGVQLAPGGFNRATFKVQGAAGRAYSIHTPGSQQFVSSRPAASGEVASLTVNNFTTLSVNQGSVGDRGQLNGSGTDTIYLGGTLVVPANAAPGVYSGLVPITVSY